MHGRRLHTRPMSLILLAAPAMTWRYRQSLGIEAYASIPDLATP
jgi:hypothetical protein